MLNFLLFILDLFSLLSLLGDDKERVAPKNKVVPLVISLFIFTLIIGFILEIQHIMLLENILLFVCSTFLFGIILAAVSMMLLHKFSLLSNIEFGYFIILLFVIGLNFVFWTNTINRKAGNILMKAKQITTNIAHL